MTKKEKDLVKKSKSAEDLTTKSKNNSESQEIKELKAQITALLEQISRIKQEANQQIKFESQKAQNYLEQITTLTAEVDGKEQIIKELTKTNNQLTDQNNELRINNLRQENYFTKYQQEQKLTQQLKTQIATLQKDLTISQQDLKSAQRIIELRTLKPANNKDQKSSFDY